MTRSGASENAASSAVAAQLSREQEKVTALRARLERVDVKVEALLARLDKERAASEERLDKERAAAERNGTKFQDRLAAQKNRVEAFSAQLENERAAAEERRTKLQHKLDIQTMRAEAFSAQLETNAAKVEGLKEALEVQRIRTERAVARGDALEPKLVQVRRAAEQSASFRPLVRFLAFGSACEQRVDDVRADLYIAHGVQALPAAARLASLTNADYACDSIEIPDFGKRGLPSRWDPITLDATNHMLAGYLSTCSRIYTVGPSLGELLDVYGPPVTVVPNYRSFSTPRGELDLRGQLGIPGDATVCASVGTVASGLEEMLDGLAKLGPNVHLVTLGRVVGEHYSQSRIDALVAERGLVGRVHMLGVVDYADLTELVSQADVGLIIFDTTIGNNQIALPNRLFDLLAAEVPIVSSPAADVVQILGEYQAGVGVSEPTGTHWAQAISEVLDQRSTFASGAERANAELSWEALEPEILASIGDARSVVFVGVNRLNENNRTARMIETLRAKNVRTGLITSDGPWSELFVDYPELP